MTGNPTAAGHSKEKTMKNLSEQYYKKLLSELREEHPFYNNTELAYEFILHEILCGNYAPGDPVTQEDIAGLIDMSRTPIRDAIDRLVQEHFLERTDRNTVQVASVQLKDYAEFWDFRLTLEAHAAYLAARNITEEQLERLEANIDRMEKLADRKDIDTVNMYFFSELDMEFHNIILESSGNRYIQESLNHFYSKEEFMMTRTVEPRRIRLVLNKHRAICDAIRSSDERKAEETMRSHLEFYLMRYLTDKGGGD